jgi:hypothetical protein
VKKGQLIQNSICLQLVIISGHMLSRTTLIHHALMVYLVMNSSHFQDLVTVNVLDLFP